MDCDRDDAKEVIGTTDCRPLMNSRHALFELRFPRHLIVLALASGFLTGPFIVIARSQVAQEPTYLNTTERLQGALADVFAELGKTPRISNIMIEPKSVALRVQGSKAAHHTDEWRVERYQFLWMDRNAVSGPTAVKINGIVGATEGSFFALSEVALTNSPQIIAQAIKKADLEEAATVTSITIARHVHILPKRRYGPIRWRIQLSSERETAIVFADAAGRIISADLSGTIRAARLDMIANDDWPMADAQAELTAIAGGEVVREVTVRSRSIGLSVEAEGNREQVISYSWNYSGIRRGLANMPNTQRIFGIGNLAAFPLSEVDFKALPKIKKAALAEISVAGARIDYLVARKATDGVGPAQVKWKVFIKLQGAALIDAGNRMTGIVTLSTTGEVLNVIQPASLQKPTNWLEPTQMFAVLQRLKNEFGADTRFQSIRFDDDRARVEVEDPQKPGAPAAFLLAPNKPARRLAPLPGMGGRLNSELLFRLADIDALDIERMTQFNRSTLDRMALKGAEVYRWTISRRKTTTPGRIVMTAAVRAGIDNGNTGGWIIFGLDGKQWEVMTP